MGPKVDLGPFLNDLRQRKEDGETWDGLAAWLQEEHNIVCDRSTIRRHFADADVANFGMVNPDPYFDEIVQQHEEGVPFGDIVDNLMKQYGIRTSERTLRNAVSNGACLQLLFISTKKKRLSDAKHASGILRHCVEVLIIDYDVDPLHHFFTNITPWPANATLRETYEDECIDSFDFFIEMGALDRVQHSGSEWPDGETYNTMIVREFKARDIKERLQIYRNVPSADDQSEITSS